MRRLRTVGRNGDPDGVADLIGKVWKALTEKGKVIKVLFLPATNGKGRHNMAMLINAAMIISVARIYMQFQAESRAGAKGAEFEHLLADALRRGGWRIIREPKPGSVQPDLVFARGDQVFFAELKRSSEGRRDRLIPLISQAILQAQAFAKNDPGRVIPVAIVAAPRVGASVADEIKRFAV